MLFIFGLLLLLIPTVTCVEMSCRFNQTDPCNATLGHKLHLQMVTDARDLNLTLYKWIDNTNQSVFEVKNNTIKKTPESIIHRSEFMFNNGTLIINSVIRTDSGTYRLVIYDSTGTQTHAVYLTVIVEGSEVATSLIALVSLAVILIVLFIPAYHFYKKKQLKPTAAVVGVGTEPAYSQITHKKHNREDDQKGSESPQTVDVECAVVSSHTTTRKKKKKKKEKKGEEVQYGELTFTPTVSNNQRQYEKQEDCVYYQIKAQ